MFKNHVLRYLRAGIFASAIFGGILYLGGDAPPVAHANGGSGVAYFTLTLCTPNHGDITNDPAGSTFVSGTVVTLTAIPDPGYEFTGWTGALSGTVNPKSITMNAHKSVCAEFKPKVSFVGGGGLVTEGGGRAVWAKLSAPSENTVTVNCSITGGTASGGGVDYVFYSGTISFAPGALYAVRELSIMEDGIEDDFETIEISLSNPVNALLGGNTQQSYTIADDEPIIVGFQSESSTMAESDGTAILPLTIQSLTAGSIRVSYAVTGTTTPGSDYSTMGNVLYVESAVSANVAIEIPIVDDALEEADETLVVTLHDPVGAVMESFSTHTVTILDNDVGQVAAAFTADPTNGIAPMEVTFTDTSEVTGTTVTGWLWDFGDGNTSTDQNPVHTYTTEGVYTVSFTVQTASGNDTVVHDDVIEVGGLGALLNVSPNFLQFGYVPIGETGYALLQIANTGDELLTGTAVVDEPFGFEGDATYALAPTEETFLTVRYSPTAVEESHDVIGVGGGGNALVSLYGSSIAPTAAGDIPGIRLNELAIWNTSGLISANGNYVDWIELYNENDFAVDLEGWSLTDDDMDPTKFVLPAGTVIGPQEFLIVFASTDTAPPVGELHTGFALDEVNGGYVGLFAPGAATAITDVDYPVSGESNRSYSLLPSESKQFAETFGIGLPSPWEINVRTRVWDLTAYASPQITQGQQLPDPELPYQWFVEGEPTHYLFLDDWLSAVESYANSIVQQNNENDYLVSPVSAANVNVNTDVAVLARTTFLNKTSVHTVSGMSHHFTSYIDSWQTVKSVPDGSVVLIGRMTRVIVGEPAPVILLGHVVHGRRTLPLDLSYFDHKHVIILAAETVDDLNEAKWHASTFAHEWGHFAGIRGHPARADDATRIMARDFGFPQPNPSSVEPWFFVSMTSEARAFYEGRYWWDFFQRRHEPNRIPDFEVEDEDYWAQGYTYDILPPW